MDIKIIGDNMYRKLKFNGCQGYLKRFNKHEKGEVKTYDPMIANELIRDYPEGFTDLGESTIEIPSVEKKVKKSEVFVNLRFLGSPGDGFRNQYNKHIKGSVQAYPQEQAKMLLSQMPDAWENCGIMNEKKENTQKVENKMVDNTYENKNIEDNYKKKNKKYQNSIDARK